MSVHKEKGLGLIEVLIALFTFVAVFISVMIVYDQCIHVDYVCSELKDATYYLEAIKNEFQVNYDYDELEKLCDKTTYINKSDLEENDIFSCGAMTLIKDYSDDKENIAIVSEKVSPTGALKITLTYSYSTGSVSCVFYKGNYKKA